jgi:hypothetical protein
MRKQMPQNRQRAYQKEAQAEQRAKTLRDTIIEFFYRRRFTLEKLPDRPPFLWCAESEASFSPEELVDAIKDAGYKIVSVEKAPSAGVAL